MSDSSIADEKRDHLTYVQEYLVKQGLDKDWEVLVAKDHELFLDLDTAESIQIFSKGFIHLKEQFPDAVVKQTLSKSGNIHIQIDLKTSLGILERMAWQSALGSDLGREMGHLISYYRGDTNSIVLIERKSLV